MPLRPIDAIFVHPERRLYVVYYRGELWQLPRMKIDDTAWQRRQPYTGTPSSLYLSSHQAITDPTLAQKLRTLNLPAAVYGSTLPQFEAWWEVHGFEWLKELLNDGKSPLAAHHEVVHSTMPEAQNPMTTAAKSTAPPSDNKIGTINAIKNNKHSTLKAESSDVSTKTDAVDIFADMLADLANEVLHHRG